MPKTLNQRYEEANAEVGRLKAISIALDDNLARCEDALRQAVANREALVARLMKGKGEKWLPPEKAPVAYFEEA